jgi:hypothetical protein
MRAKLFQPTEKSEAMGDLLKRLRCGANGYLCPLGAQLLLVVVTLCVTGCVTMIAHQEYDWGEGNSPYDNVEWQTTVGPRVMTLPAVGQVAGDWVYQLQVAPTPLYLVINRRSECWMCNDMIIDTLPRGVVCPTNYPPLELVVAAGVIPVDYVPEEDAEGNPRRAMLLLEPWRGEYDWATLGMSGKVVKVPSDAVLLSYRARGMVIQKGLSVNVKGPLVVRPMAGLYVLTGALDVVLAPVELLGLGVLWAVGMFDWQPMGGH